MANYFISDLHFGHKNILTYDGRDFKTIEEHDKTIIDNWNSTVNADDDIYILGDISWHNAKETSEILESLKGRKHLIIGNHDTKMLRRKEIQRFFVEITHYKEIHLLNGKGIVLCHYPIPCFNHHFNGWYHLYGHVHNSFEWDMMQQIKEHTENVQKVHCNMYNVGIMMPYMEYRPKTLEEIVETVDKEEKLKHGK